MKIQDFIPFALIPKRSCKIGFEGPFKLLSITKSAIALSYKIQGTTQRIVFSIIWPLKLIPGGLNQYSVAMIKDSNNDALIKTYLQSFLQKEVFNSNSYPSKIITVENFQRYHFWAFQLGVNKYLNVLTNMGDSRVNGMTVKVGLTLY